MNILDETKQKIRETLSEAVIANGFAKEEEIPDIILETPKDKDHGDYASNIAMQLARVAKRNPREIAEGIARHFDKEKTSVRSLEVAGPGFINVFLDQTFLRQVLPTVLREGAAYGRSNAGEGTSVLVEFVSANPTGTLHLGHARGAAVGDALCNILDMAGYKVGREYYINDAGNQIDKLALSLDVRYLQTFGREADMPGDAYQGPDIIGIAEQIARDHGDALTALPEKERRERFRELGLDYLLEKMKTDLNDFRVSFDTWFSETSLYTAGKVEETLETLRANGEVYEKDGATWFQSTRYGDDKDRVLVKNDGAYTYLLPDIAYHKDKLDRGFDKLVDLFGADHHGYIPRMHAAIQALGYPKEKLDFQVGQNVNLVSEYVSDDSVHAIAAVIAQQEVVHNESYSYVLSSLFGFEDQKQIFEDARTNPTIIARNERIMRAYDDFIENPTEEKLAGVIVYSLILEGIFFYSGFAFFYNLARQQKMNATAQIISFINRDELVHGKFMSELLRAILGENPHLNTPEFNDFVKNEFQHAVESEIAWSNEVLDGVFGIDLDEMHTYIQYRANKMLKMLGLDPLYPDAHENVMPWIKAFVDNFDETKTDFFEARNRSYEKVDADNGFDEL